MADFVAGLMGLITGRAAAPPALSTSVSGARERREDSGSPLRTDHPLTVQLNLWLTQLRITLIHGIQPASALGRVPY